MTMPRPIVINGDKPVPPPLCEAPRYLRAIADAYDASDDARGWTFERTVQRDLRAWADDTETMCHA